MVARHNIKDKPRYLKETREALDMSQVQFGQAMGVSSQTVYFWETKKRGVPPLAIEWCVAVQTLLRYAPKEKTSDGIDQASILMSVGLGGLISSLLVGIDDAGLSGLIQQQERTVEDGKKAKD